MNPGGSGQRGSAREVECDYAPACQHCKQPPAGILEYRSKRTMQREAIYFYDACGDLRSIGYGIYA
jgi:hypothetical protein